MKGFESKDRTLLAKGDGKMKRIRLAVGIVLGIAVFLGIQAINFAGGFDGGRAGALELGATAVYVVFWAGFSCLFRREPVAMWLCFGIALLTVVGGLSFFSPIDFVVGTLVMIFFAGVPLYGLRFFMEWTGVYIFAGAAGAVWAAWSVWMLRLEKRRRLRD